MRYPTVFLSALVLVTSCTHQRDLEASRVGLRATSRFVENEVAPAVAEPAVAMAAAALPKPQDDFLTPSERAMFASPEFKKRVIASWSSESDIEPELSDDERKRLVSVLELVSSDSPDWSRAEQLAREARQPDCSASVDFMFAHVLAQQGKHKEALPIYQEACDKFPKFRRAWMAMADAAVQANEFDIAILGASKVISLGGGDGILWGILGLGHFKKDRPLSAESAFRMAMALDPANGKWKQGLAESFFAQERYLDAIALLEELLREQPDSAELWLAQGRAYANVENFARAAENFEVVDQLGGATAETLGLLGAIYAKQELFTLSAAAFVRAFEKDRRAPISTALNVARFMIGADAIEDVRTLLRGIEETRGDALEKQDKQALLRVRASLAVATDAGDEEHAKILNELIELDPLDGQALILLGRHHARNEPQRAIDYFERAASLPEFAADAKIRHGEVLAREHRYSEAAVLLRAALQIKKSDNVEAFLKDIERMARLQSNTSK